MSKFINRSTKSYDVNIINSGGDIKNIINTFKCTNNSSIINSAIYCDIKGYNFIPHWHLNVLNYNNAINISDTKININIFIETMEATNYNISNSIITTKSIDETNIKSIKYYVTNFYDESEDYFAKYYKRILQKLK